MWLSATYSMCGSEAALADGGCKTDEPEVLLLAFFYLRMASGAPGVPHAWRSACRDAEALTTRTAGWAEAWRLDVLHHVGIS